MPCGQCIGCRLERSRQTAVRCVHELALHDRSSFITLTYAPEKLPRGGSLVVKDVQDFLKRVRRSLSKLQRVRFLCAGEYGDPEKLYPGGPLRNPSDNVGRPHYHLVLFGLDFPDRVYRFESSPGVRCYTSERLSALWGKGFATCGDVTFESAAYVARYCVKKVNGDLAPLWYQRVDPGTGEIHVLVPEFSTRSLKPGLGQGWLQRYMDDVYPSDEVVVRGKSSPVPRYYDKLLAMGDRELFDYLKLQRRSAASWRSYRDPHLLKKSVHERVKLAQVAFLKRGLGEDQ